MSPTTDPPQSYEPRPDPHVLTVSDTDRARNVQQTIDYEPQHGRSLPISSSHQAIVNAITQLYSGSASEADMQVYDDEAIYDDPWSYCDTRYKIAGQWYGIPMIMPSSKTIATEVVKDDDREIIFKLQQEYKPKGLPGSGKKVNSLVSLALDEQGKVKYHKDMWNEKDYSHEGLGKIMKTLNGDHLTKITRPPTSL